MVTYGPLQQRKADLDSQPSTLLSTTTPFSSAQHSTSELAMAGLVVTAQRAVGGNEVSATAVILTREQSHTEPEDGEDANPEEFPSGLGDRA